MTIKIYEHIEQGTEEWHEVRRGVITASKVGAMLTATGKIANNATSRRAVLELASERLSGFTEETATTYAMRRGHDDEELAIEIYSEKVAPVRRVGFVTNDEYGLLIGCSPDGLVGEDGGVECKSRLHAIQLQTIIDGVVPDEFKVQIQFSMLVLNRPWWDFISAPAFGGSKIMLIKTEPDLSMKSLLIDAAHECERRVKEAIAEYQNRIADGSLRFLDMPRREPEISDVVRL